MEAQAKVAQEWERQQLRQAAENARLEAERSSLEQVGAVFGKRGNWVVAILAFEVIAVIFFCSRQKK